MLCSKAKRVGHLKCSRSNLNESVHMQFACKVRTVRISIYGNCIEIFSTNRGGHTSVIALVKCNNSFPFHQSLMHFAFHLNQTQP